MPIVNKNTAALTLSEQARLVLSLSVPAILAQLTTIVMEYLDAAMVGHLGAAASAAIGIVSTSTWLLGGICGSAASGFAVQVAHRIGALDLHGARSILRQSLLTVLTLSIAVGCVAMAIAPFLPHWLGGAEDVCRDATRYFLLFGASLPLWAMNHLLSGMLRCAGDMKTPSVVNILACVLDVLFNYLFIFVCKLGVLGAALGTISSIAIAVCILLLWLWFRPGPLQMRGHGGPWRVQEPVLKEAVRIGGPMAVEHAVMCSAQVCGTLIVAPLGTAAIAANAFGIIIEGLCYMPGYGIGEAATTLVGQSVGAGRNDLRRSFSWLSMGLGMVFMTVMGAVMYWGVPYLMPLMTPDVTVQELTVMALRIEAFAEPMYAASIVAYGVFVGAGDTLVPCVMNLGSIWCVRIPLALWLSRTMGLRGVWIAMAIELCFRGTIFVVRLIKKGNQSTTLR